MAGITYNDVRDFLNFTSTDIPDSKVLKMIGRAEVTPEVELSKDTDYADCTEAQKESITLLAARVFVIALFMR